MKLRYEPPLTTYQAVEVEGAICEASVIDIRPGETVEANRYIEIQDQENGGNFVFEDGLDWE